MTDSNASWQAVIGLETHVQLGTESKIFTSASTNFGETCNPGASLVSTLMAILG